MVVPNCSNTGSANTTAPHTCPISRKEKATAPPWNWTTHHARHIHQLRTVPPAFQDGKAVYDPGVKITLKNGKWAPHPRSQFRINLKDIGAIYQKVARGRLANFGEIYMKRNSATIMHIG